MVYTPCFEEIYSNIRNQSGCFCEMSFLKAGLYCVPTQMPRQRIVLAYNQPWYLDGCNTVRLIECFDRNFRYLAAVVKFLFFISSFSHEIHKKERQTMAKAPGLCTPHGGMGGFSAKFRVGGAAHSFKM